MTSKRTPFLQNPGEEGQDSQNLEEFLEQLEGIFQHLGRFPWQGRFCINSTDCLHFLFQLLMYWYQSWILCWSRNKLPSKCQCVKYFMMQTVALKVYHYCHFDGRQDSFLCSNGTVFNQKVLLWKLRNIVRYIFIKVFTCDWWYNVNCAASEDLYTLNNNLYEVISMLNSWYESK